jgi:hypothetical protein
MPESRHASRRRRACAGSCVADDHAEVGSLWWDSPRFTGHTTSSSTAITQASASSGATNAKVQDLSFNGPLSGVAFQW